MKKKQKEPKEEKKPKKSKPMRGKITKITRNSVYMDVEKDWKRFPVQINIKKSDLEDAIRFLGNFIQFTISSEGYLKILSKRGSKKGKLDTS